MASNIQNLGKIKLGDNVEESISDITNSISGFASMLEESFGVYIGQDFKEILEGVGAFFGAVEGFDITKPISSTLNLLTGLGKSIGSIFGLGNGDVYADYKYGDKFTIKTIKLENSGFRTLNELERNTIKTYSAYSRGYNKTRGNKG